VTAVHPVRRWWRRPSTWLGAIVVATGLFAPLIANEVPLAARVDGKWSFPAFADLVGSASSKTGPDELSWKRWWARLPADSPDFALMPPWPYGPLETNLARVNLPPSVAHLFGCDDTGRDVFARIVHGASGVAWLAVPAVVLGGVVGSLLGAWAALRRGVADAIVCRLIELFSCFPVLLFLLFASAFLGGSGLALVVVMAALFWPSFARIVRGELLGLREREFVRTAQGLGVPPWRIVTHHLLPQLRSAIGVTAAFCTANAVVAESTLSYLGIGPTSLRVSWGSMLQVGAEQAVVGAWHLWLFPALAIAGVVVGCHALADRLRRDPARER
jgi:ABC-type dipeptide/oligopeptide/nickel transport system permease subunit